MADYWAIDNKIGVPIGLYSVATDSQNNVYATGSGDGDVLFLKYNSQGALVFQRKLSFGSENLTGYGIAVDLTDNVIVVGAYNPSVGDDSGFVVKYSSDGDVVWQRQFGGVRDVQFYGVAADSAGNINIVGDCEGAQILQYNSSGTLQWQRRLGGGNTEFAGVAVDSSDNILAVGFTFESGQGGADAFLVKYSPLGVISSQHTFGDSNNNYTGALAVASDGHVYLVGYNGDTEVFIDKVDSSGALVWSKQISIPLTASNDPQRYGVAVDSSDNPYLMYPYTTQPSDSDKFVVAKLNTSGVVQWATMVFVSSGANFVTMYSNAHGLALDSEDDVSVVGTGRIVKDGVSVEHAYAIKLPPDGSITGLYGNFTFTAIVPTIQDASHVGASSTLTEEASSESSSQSLYQQHYHIELNTTGGN